MTRAPYVMLKASDASARDAQGCWTRRSAGG